MRRCLAVIVLLLFAAAAVADEEEDSPAAALIVDTGLKRMPEHTVAPTYPRKARRDRIEGEVQVCFEVNRQGRPRRVAVRNSSHRIFEKPSVRAVKASSFRPLPKDAPDPGIKSCRTFVYSLEPIESPPDDQTDQR